MTLSLNRSWSVDVDSVACVMGRCYLPPSPPCVRTMEIQRGAIKEKKTDNEMYTKANAFLNTMFVFGAVLNGEVSTNMVFGTGQLIEVSSF